MLGAAWYLALVDHLNPIQLKILSTLLFRPGARFRDLNTDSLGTDHFSYHLRSCVDLGLVEKDGQTYTLTSKGKMLAGKIDTTTHKIEKQPKVSVILIAHKVINGQKKFLVQQRTKEPYFGYWGCIAGKVKFGETLFETAGRELQEEAGVSAKFRFCYEIHEMVYAKASREQLEDKFFHIIECYALDGEIAKKTPEGANLFVTEAEFRQLKPKYHNEDDLLTWFLNRDFKFKEKKYLIDHF